MTISIPDTLTTDNSGKYKVSIRLQSDGLSFSGYIPSEGNTFFYREVVFDPALPYVSSLKDFFYAHEFLSWEYCKVYVMVDTPVYTLVPDVAFQPGALEQLLSFVHTARPGKAVSNHLPEEAAHVVFGMEPEVHEFCSRSFIQPEFLHSMTPLLSLWKQQSQISIPARMYVVLFPKRIDIVVFRQGQLLFANSFQTVKAEDIVYYILYVWRQTQLDQQHDQLFLFGEFSHRQSILQILHVYLAAVGVVEIPSEAWLLGDTIGQAPMDVIALSVCEL